MVSVATGPAADGRAAPGRWYQKPKWLLMVAVVAIVAIAVVLDLPTPVSASGRRADLTAYMRTLRQDIGQCSGGVQDAVTAYRDAQAGRLPASTARTFVSQGIDACSFTNGGMVDLGQIQPPRSLARLHLDSLAGQVDAWGYRDGYAALKALERLLAVPPAPGALAAFNQRVVLLNRTRSSIDATIAGAQRSVGLPARPLGLASISPLG